MLHSIGISDPTVAYPPPHFVPYTNSTLPPNSLSPSDTCNPLISAIPRSVNGISTATTAAVAALTAAAAAASAGIPPNIKDSRWLTLEVCRQFQRNQCSRDENECKFAHPPNHVDVQSGRVVCCYDSIKGKCQRRDPPCKYLHPPQHLREQLIQNGRNNMIMRNIQFQLFQQQLLAHAGLFPIAAAAAAAVNNSVTNGAPGNLPTSPNPVMYAAPNALSTPGTFPFLNMGFAPCLNAITTTGLPRPLPNGTARHLITTNDGLANIPKRTSLMGDAKQEVNGYTHQTVINGNMKSENQTDLPANSIILLNGSSLDGGKLKELNGTTQNGHVVRLNPIVSSTAVANGNNNFTANAAAAAALFRMQSATNPAISLNLPHPNGASLASLNSIAAAASNGLVGPQNGLPSHFQVTVPEHTGYFPPAYHIEIPAFSYQ